VAVTVHVTEPSLVNESRAATDNNQRYKVLVSHKRDIISFDHFHRNIYKAVYLHLRLYCGVDVTMVANEVNKFGQIFRIYRRRKYKDMG
jgi:hypothetical protein